MVEVRILQRRWNVWIKKLGSWIDEIVVECVERIVREVADLIDVAESSFRGGRQAPSLCLYF